ncbi:DUF4037 domain-containing protein [Demequina rhizosphaerae]|uniref:DUF4037 domain-containing protein n=1 Tax=Demequina rhizosphaerae TaxID=1638985 RepID=UPI000781408C|nr:DUF4037 domain-containing protein [Demequina rhizosphaerae]
MDPAAPPFDPAAFLRGLDALHASGAGPDAAERYLRDALAAAGDDPGPRLQVLNEAMGHHRSVGLHDDAVREASEALALVDRLGAAGSEAHATTLINAATAHRAAGRQDDALALYRDARAVATRAFPAGDRRLAALRNNLALALAEAGDHAAARDELVAALAILEGASVDPGADLDIAATRSNLALECLALGLDEEARDHTGAALAIVRRGGHREDPHAAAMLASHAQACLVAGRAAEAVELYAEALAIVERSYGAGSDAYAITADNLAAARRAPAAGGTPATAGADPAAASSPAQPQDPDEPPPGLTGMDLARELWEEHVKPMLVERYPAHRGRIAVGLVGHGSECYGFDDAASRDHDFGPGLCLWLTAADHAAIGAALHADYDALPAVLHGIGPRVETARAQGPGRRVGVFEIGEFFASVAGRAAPPAADSPHEWMLLDEATLAAATNGAVFADPLGAFSAVRNGFRRMPDDVRLARLAQRLGMIAQAGQYNVPRMLDRGDGEAAWLAVAELSRATASLVHLLNGPTAVGYLPYYKWHFAALRALAARPASRLPEVHADLSEILRLASAACLGGAGFGEGGGGADPARARLEAAIERMCARIVVELRVQGLSRSDADFLEHHRGEVQSRIRDPWLRAL